MSNVVDTGLGLGLCERLRAARSMMSGQLHEERLSVEHAGYCEPVTQIRRALDLGAYCKKIFEDHRSRLERHCVPVQLSINLEAVFVAVPAAVILGTILAELAASAIGRAAADGAAGTVGVHLWRINSLPASASMLVAHSGGSFSERSDQHVEVARRLVGLVRATMACEPGRITIWRVEMEYPIIVAQ